jgi:hypothetical protein
MDLECLGAPDLAASLLEAYTEFSDEHHPSSLAHHYIAYRALVRAKIAWLREPEEGAATVAEAESLLQRCLSHLEAARVRLVLVGGPPGTGKSTLARSLGERRGWAVLSSDEIRKEQAGRPWTDHGGDRLDEGIYGPDSTEATYRTLLDRARHMLELGGSVVLDASWGRAADRAAAARLADDTVSDLAELLCACPAATIDERVRARREEGRDVSDADEDVARQLADRFEAWPTAIEVGTANPLDHVVAEALAVLDGAGGDVG